MNMTLEELQKASKKELVVVAKNLSVVGFSKMTRKELISFLSKKLEKSDLKTTAYDPLAQLVAKENSSSFQEDISATKYVVTMQKAIDQFPMEHEVIPDKYGVTRIVLLVRDPYWMHTYWEITPERLAQVKSLINHSHQNNAKLALRVMDVTDTDPHFPNNFAYIDVTPDAQNWYIHVLNADRVYCVEIGFLCSDGKFYLLARSNAVRVPRSGMSNIFDERWMSIEDYDRLYLLSGGLGIGGSSMELMRKKGELLMREFLSGGASESLIRKKEERNFYLNADTELIVYGSTVPGSKLTIGGKEKKLNPDGTFSIRFHLTDGLHSIPIRAESADGKDERSITFVVTREAQ